MHVKDGLLVMGVPVGKPEWEQTKCNEIASHVADVYTLARKVETKQAAQLLSVYCGGVPCINHLLRSSTDEALEDAIYTADDATKESLRVQLGLDRVPQMVRNQCALPLRHGGMGYRMAENIADPAILGGFTCAAYLGFGIGDIDGSLADVANNPDGHDNLAMVKSMRRAWRRVIDGDRHLRTLAIAAAANHPLFADEDDSDGGDGDGEDGEDCPDMERKYEVMWRKDFVHGGAPAGTVASSTEHDDKVLAEVEAMRNAGELSNDQLAMIDHPADHANILRIWCGTPWIQKHWTIQKLVDRSLTRKRFLEFWGRLEFLEDELRVRAHMNPLAGIPLRALPNTPKHQCTDAVFTWIMHERLGIQHPEAVDLGKCTCKAGTDIDKGRHCMRCKVGNGPTIVHDAVRDEVAAMHREAGVVVSVEVEGLLKGSDERPADVLAHGIGRQHRDLAIDIAVVDAQVTTNINEARRCALSTGHRANQKEHEKRTAKPSGQTLGMEDRLLKEGIDCMPIIFEMEGAATSTWAKYIKKLSEIAHTRRGHDQQYFVAKWKTIIAMTIARRGAEVGIRRCHTLRIGVHAPARDDTDSNGPLGGFGVEPPHVVGIEAAAAPSFANGCGFFSC